MGKTVRRLLMTIVGLGTFGISILLVLHAEDEKRKLKIVDLEKKYQTQTDEILKYRTNYLNQVLQLKKENNLQMDEIKAKYDTLLTQQSDILKQHIKVVSENTTLNNPSYNPATNTISVTRTVQVSKPSSGSSSKTS